jgi:methyl-accepting chemotaxis protein
MLDEIFDNFFNDRLDARLVEIFGPNYRKIRDTLNDLNRTKEQHLQRIDKLEKTADTLAGNIDAINKNNEKSSWEIANLQSKLKNHGGFILKVDNKIDELAKKINDLERTMGLQSGAIGSATQNNAKLLQEIADLRSQLKNCGEDIIGAATKNNELSQKVNNLEKNYPGIISSVTQNNARLSQEIADLRSQFRNNEFSQMIKELNIKLKRLTDDASTANDKNRELAKKIADLELKNRHLSSRIDEYESKRTHGKLEKSNGEAGNGSYNVYSGQSAKAHHNAQADSIITKFNNWAANPAGRPIPPGFAFLEGNFKILTKQPLTKTREETNWIINENGEKKYLFPNPNLFNQMTDIRELYSMNQNMLKEKGRNKIEITAACEISASGWIEFAGELKILT